jgi:hypothetical protein
MESDLPPKGDIRPAHRPLKGTQPRVVLRARVDAEALRRIDLARKNKRQSLGDIITEFGLSLPER